MRKAFAFAAAAALGMAGSALAAPYFLKINSIEGESTEKAHGDWIALESLQVAKTKAKPKPKPSPRPTTMGGATVSQGDFNGDRPAPAPRATATITNSTTSDRASHELTHSVQQRAAKPEPALARGLAVKKPDPVPAALLLPAVQKVRSAHLKKTAWPGCHPGQALGGVQIRDQATGRTGRILDATVEQCASEQVSLNFSKIEW